MDWLPGRRRTDDPTTPERDLGVEVDQLRWQVDDLRSEVAALRAQVGRLLDHIERLSARQQPTVIRAAPATAAESSATLRRAGALSTATPPPTVAPETKAEPVGPVLEAYREAAADLAGAGESFIAERAPRGLTRVADGEGWRLDEDVRGAFLWGVPHGRAWLLLPGYRAMKDWRSHFAYQREQNATEYFGEAFDLDPAPGRFDVVPAIAQAEDELLKLKRRGTIRGFRG